MKGLIFVLLFSIGMHSLSAKQGFGKLILYCERDSVTRQLPPLTMICISYTQENPKKLKGKVLGCSGGNFEFDSLVYPTIPVGNFHINIDGGRINGPFADEFFVIKKGKTTKIYFTKKSWKPTDYYLD